MFNTRQKKLVLKVINDSYTHPTAQEIYEECRKEMPNISLGTVYRNLNVLIDEGKIQTLSTSSNRTRYDHIDDKSDHNHFICMFCGNIYDIYERINLPKEIDDNKVIDYELTIKGICKKCQEEGKK